MANTLRFKRGLVSGIPTAALGEPLFTTDTFDLYIGNGTTNTRFQKYIASGATTQILRGDGSLYTFPLAISSPTTGQVLKYNGTSWVNDSDAGITGSGSAGQVAYFTGATTQAGSNALFWDATNLRLGIGNTNPDKQLTIASTFPEISLRRTDSASPASAINFVGSDNAAKWQLATNNAVGGAHFEFNYAGSNFMLLRTNGNLLLGTTTSSGQKLQVVGTGYFSDSVGIGSTSLTGFSLLINHSITTGAAVAAASVRSTIQSQVTTEWNSYQSLVGTQAATFTLGSLRHFSAQQSSFGANSVVTNQFGFKVDGNLTGATNNFAFHSDLNAATGRWNLYMNGTANNYMAGSLGIGSTSLTGYNVRVSRGITGATVAYGITSDGTIQSDVTSSGLYFSTLATTQNTTFTLNNLFHFSARQSTFGASSTVTKQVGFFVESSLVSAGTNIGFESNIAAASGRWNFYASGTAPNYLNGELLIGNTSNTGEKLQVTGTMKVTGQVTINNNLNVIASNPNVIARDNGTGYAVFVAQGQNGTGAILDSGVQGSIAGSLMTGAPVNSAIIGTRGSHELHFGTNGNSRMYLTTNGNLAVDTNTFFVDATNNYVGVGTATPNAKFHISSGSGDHIRLTRTSQTDRAIVVSSSDMLSIGTWASPTQINVNTSGNVGIGSATPTAFLDVRESTTGSASIRIRSGAAPTTLNDGDIWFDGTDLKMRIGGVTKTFTLV